MIGCSYVTQLILLKPVGKVIVEMEAGPGIVFIPGLAQGNQGGGITCDLQPCHIGQAAVAVPAFGNAVCRKGAGRQRRNRKTENKCSQEFFQSGWQGQGFFKMVS